MNGGGAPRARPGPLGPEDARRAGFALPARAHVPGTDTEPDRALLHRAKTLCPARVAAAEWRGNRAYLHGWALFDAGFYWEAHEVWEAVWRRAAPNGRERRLLGALIQFANARLKRRMGRGRAALRLLAEVESALADLDAGCRADAPAALMGADCARLGAVAAAERAEL